jgi:hypothetical protein
VKITKYLAAQQVVVATPIQSPAPGYDSTGTILQGSGPQRGHSHNGIQAGACQGFGNQGISSSIFNGQSPEPIIGRSRCRRPRWLGSNKCSIRYDRERCHLSCRPIRPIIQSHRCPSAAVIAREKVKAIRQSLASFSRRTFPTVT